MSATRFTTSGTGSSRRNSAAAVNPPSEAICALLAGEEDALSLDRAALEIASLHSPLVDPDACLAQLDGWGAELLQLAPPSCDDAHFLSALQTLVYSRLGFAGDSEDYYSPLNSCFDQLLLRRRGLPITLAVLLMELSRRAGRALHGVALPAHFVCRFDSGPIRIFLDPFDHGRLLTEDDCLDLVRSLTGRSLPSADHLFQPAPHRQIVLRIISNLRGAYARRGDRHNASRLDAWLRLAAESLS